MSNKCKEPETLPGLGTPEAAVRSCVQLMSQLFSQPPEYVAYYLDLYYQVRRAYEAGRLPQSATPTAPSEREPCAPAYPAPARTMNTPKAPEPKAKPAAKPGPTQTREESRPWSNAKREIRERFLTLRAEGMSIAQAVNLSGGKLREGDVLTILNAGKAEMKVYNALEGAMNKYEEITKAKAPQSAAQKEAGAS